MMEMLPVIIHAFRRKLHSRVEVPLLRVKLKTEILNPRSLRYLAQEAGGFKFQSYCNSEGELQRVSVHFYVDAWNTCMKQRAFLVSAVIKVRSMFAL
jgi:hypothetical protein